MAGIAPDNIRLGQNGEAQPADDGGQNIIIDAGDAPTIVTVDPEAQTVTTEQPDGSMIVEFGPTAAREGEAMEHDANLAEFLEPGTLANIASDLLDGIQQDINDRAEWLETRSQGIKLLGLQLKQPQSSASSDGQGVSTVDHPMLLDATLRFQANARGELLPAGGPVKVRDDRPAVKVPKPPVVPPMSGAPMPPPAAPDGLGAPMPPEGMDPGAAPPPLPENTPVPDAGIGMPQPGMEAMGANGGPPLEDEAPGRDEMAEALEADLNHYLTVTAKEYYPDTDRMLFYVGFGGCSFKKVYRCPLRRRPVSESVDATFLIVPNSATDLTNAGRVTHQIMMNKSTFKRMQIVGAYRHLEQTEMVTPTPTPNAVQLTTAEVQGLTVTTQRPEDAQHTIYECYCELDIPGYEHVDPETGEPSGLPIPYTVVIDKDSREILNIRRNYEEDDELCLPNIPFVKYPFVPGLGFYDIGLVHILGNTTRAVTGAWRLMLDSGMFANFPGFLFLKSAMRGNVDTTFRVAPGQGKPIDSSATDIRQAVMELPYKDVGTGLMALVGDISETAQRVGGTAEIAVGEGRQDAPVGTTIALMEQATKIVDAVHKRIHAAQAEEFMLLKELFRQDPEPLWRGYKKSKLGAAIRSAKDEAEKAAARNAVLLALEDADIVPAADPNTPSHMHRVMKAVAIMQLAQANPELYDMKEVHERVMRMIHVEDPEGLFNKEPPAPPEPSPDMVAGIQGELQKQTMIEQSKQALADKNNHVKLLGQQIAADGKVAAEVIKYEGASAQSVMDMAMTIVELHRRSMENDSSNVLGAAKLVSGHSLAEEKTAQAAKMAEQKAKTQQRTI